MTIDKLNGLLNTLGSDLMLLDGQEIDVPAAGRFFNIIEEIIGLAEDENLDIIIAIGQRIHQLLETMVLGKLTDIPKGLALFVEGISLMQRLSHDYRHKGKIEDGADDYLGQVADLLGIGQEEGKGSAGPRGEVEGTSTAQALGQAHEKLENKKVEKQEGMAALSADESLLKDFIIESMEYINEIEINILNLEQNPTDKDCINSIFRPFHSIKGVAGFLNLVAIRDLAHNLENLLDKARNDQLEINSDVIDVILDGADALKTLIGVLKGQMEGKAEEDLVIPDLSDLYGRISSLESAEGSATAGKKLGEILIAEGVISEKILAEALKVKESVPEQKLGETLIKKGVVSPKQVSQALRKQTDHAAELSTIRIDTGKLDDLIDMVGELVITQSMIQQDLKNQINLDRNLTRNLAQYARITSGLQRLSMGLRMIQIKQTFQRMSRLVRDLAKQAGKVIDVILVGEDTEIDRNMVDEIYNPLVHMVRNSVDHGIEPPEERERLGKPIRGTIQLKAYHRGDNVVIEIADDGRGLNKEKILQKAKSFGQIQNIDVLTDQDIYRLIFMPGLSTAEKVTDVSGRGVGMDVVKRAVEKLRGNVDIESKPGKGTTFITRFPLTMAIIDGMIVMIGAERYILPTSSIKKILRPTVDSCSSVIGRADMIKVMDTLYPLIRLYRHFNITPRFTNPWEGIIVVLESGSRAKCLMVDQIVGRAEVVIKGLGAAVKKTKGVSGGAILGDGRIGLILDVEGLFDMAEG